MFMKSPEFYSRFNVNGLLRADAQTRFNIYQIAIANGIYSPNDCREFEDENPRDGGDEYVDPATRGSAVTPAPSKMTQTQPDQSPGGQDEQTSAKAVESGLIWAKHWAREMVRGETAEVLRAAKRHASKPEEWRRFVASYYGRRAVQLGACCDPAAAEAYCTGRREAILASGISVLEKQDEAEATLVALAAGGKA
jgi:hypothetical protein